MNSLEYWRKREAEQLRKRIADEEERGKAIEKIYAEMRDAIQKQIDAFYGKYAKAEGITIAEAKKRASKLDIEAYSRKAKKYVAEKNFTDKANAEMKLYNMTMKVNRLELLKAEIGSELCAGFSELEKEFDADLMNDAVSEMERQAGILGTTISDQVKRARGLVDASFHNATFSDRIWMYQAMLKGELSTLLQEGFVQGRNSKELARHLTKTFGVSASDAERLMRTEMTRVYTAAQHESLTEAGYDQYTFIAEPTACDVCKQLDGKHFPVEDLEKVGEHAPPIHPNCRCSVAAYMDREEFDRWLDGDNAYDKSFSDRARKIKSEDDLRKISKSSIINLQNYDEIVDYFKDAYGIDVIGFNAKDLFAVKTVLAGYDDFIKAFPEVQTRIRRIEYNSHLRVYGRMHRDGLSEVGPLGIGDYGTGVHESTHALDYLRSRPLTTSYSDSIVEEARKNLHLRKGSKEYINLLVQITGSAEDIDKAYEIMAFAAETFRAGPDNKLAREIYRLMKG